MGIAFDQIPEVRLSFRAYAREVAKRLPLRPVHQTHLPSIRMHHTTVRSGLVHPDEYHEKVWAGGRWLASYILRHSEKFLGKRVVDIGSGSGIVAIAAARVGAEATVIDSNYKAILMARLNARANRVKLKTVETRLTRATPLVGFDILTAADTGYNDHMNDALIETLSLAFHTKSKAVLYVCDQSGWTYSDFIRFKGRVAAACAECEVLKGGEAFPSPGSPSNNNSITALKITVSP